MYAEAPSIEALRPTWRIRVYITALVLAFLATIGFAISAIAAGSLFAGYNSTNVTNSSIQLEPGDVATINITSTPPLAAGAVVTSYSAATGVASIATAYEFTGASGDANFSVTAVDSGNTTLTFATAGWGSVAVDVYVGWPITYNLNGGSGDVPITGYYYENTSGADIVDDTGFSYNGYTFSGWNDDPNGNGTSYLTTDTYGLAADVTLYAQWTANSYDVTYYGNGATSGSTIAGSYTTGGTPYTIESNGFTRDGYSFLGWSTISSDVIPDSNYDPADTYSTSANLVLYAIWQANSYDIFYDGNGSDGGSIPLAGSYTTDGTPYTIEGGTQTRTGYNFLGWSTNSSDTTPDLNYEAGDTYSSVGDITLYAIWEGASYDITYYGNGAGGGSTTGGSYTTGGTPYTIESNGFTRDGYSFLGWSTNNTDTLPDKNYEPGDSYSSSSTLDLYAIWEAISYDIFYDGNGADGGNVPATGSYTTDGTPYVIEGGSHTRTGYTFLGWSTNSSDTSPDTNYEIGDLYQSIGDITLYAVWSADTYDITYVSQYWNSGTTNAGTYTTDGTPYTIESNGWVREGYTFIGWSTTAGAVTADSNFDPGDSYSTPADIELNAVWVANTYDVNYDGNGSDGGSVPSAGLYTFDGVYYVIEGGSQTRTGYYFAGWSTNSYDNTVDYVSGDTYFTAADITLYAVWTGISYDVTYDGNGANSGNVPAGSYTTGGSSYTIETNAFDRTGYTFLGWSATSTDVTGDANYAPGSTYASSANLTLYAIWDAIDYTIYYYGNGADSGSDPSNGSYTPGSGSYTISGEGSLTKTGATFIGWSTISSDVSGDPTYAVGASYDTAADLTLYAIWQDITYTISYDVNGGSGLLPADGSFTYCDVNVGSGSGITYAGYTFSHWSTVSNDTGTSYDEGDALCEAQNTTLYAIWTANTYNIVYYGNGHDGGFSNVGSYTTGDPAYTIEASTYTRSGYSFLGWSTNSSDVTGDASFDVGASYSTSDHLNLYAIWSLNNYNITYYGNTNTGGTAPIAVSFDVLDGTYTIQGPGDLVKDGYTFLGWSTSSSDTSVEYESGDSYDTLADLDLYALWGGATYGIYYSANGAQSGSYVDGTYTVGGPAYTIANNGFVRNGYSFVGWSTNSSDVTGDASYDAGDSYDTAADLYLFAIWSLNSYNITYDGNTNTGGTAPGAVSFDVLDGTYTIQGPGDLVKDGYTFLGWSTNSSDTSATYVSGDSYDTLADLTLYAIWSGNGYDITYNGNFASGGSTAPGTYVVGGPAYTIANNGFNRTGHTFDHWETLSGDVYYEGDSYDTAADLVLYAIWTSNSYDVTYYANGGQGSVPSVQTFAFGPGSVTISGTSLTLDGYDFAGWNTEPDGSGDQYLVGTVYADAADLDLYAQWTEIPSGGGGGDTDPEPPVITSSPVICTPTGTATLNGLRLNGLSRLEAGGKTLQILSHSASSITVKVPFDLIPGLYDVKGYYEGGSIIAKNALLVEVDLAVWTKRISYGQAKMYAKWPVLEGKIQFKVNGKETAWIRAVDYTDPKLFRAEGVGYYLVRTVELKAGKNALEIYQDGVRIWRAAYWK